MNSVNPKESKKDLIIEAAILVFSHKGYHHSKMEEIAVEAGIGKGTIYEYFSSKLQLLQEIMERSFHLYDQSLMPDKVITSTTKERIMRLVEGHFRFCQENKELTRILFWDTDIMDEELRDWACQKRTAKEQQLQAFFEAGIRSGEIRAVDAKLLTLMIGGILSSIWLPVVIEDWEIDAANAAEQVTDIIMNGIKK
jgi:AcrR family transcriptional regulator